MLSHYHAAKTALARGSTYCQQADLLAKETETSLASCISRHAHACYLRDALAQQRSTVGALAHVVAAEARSGQATLEGTWKALDALNAQLNEALAALKRTRLPRALHASQQHQAESMSSGSSSELTTTTRAKTLYDFADDAGVEKLKGDLRQGLDDLQETQEQLAQLDTRTAGLVSSLDRRAAPLPAVPRLHLPHLTGSSLRSVPKQDVLSLSQTAEACRGQQADHLESLADLLLSLSQHYDHACALVKADGSLQLEAKDELQEIVEQDALQLEDVLAEMADRVADLEEDAASIQAHGTALQDVVQQLEQIFTVFDTTNLDAPLHTLESLREARAERIEAVAALQEQLRGLADQFDRFSESFDALLLELDRRAGYEASVEEVLDQTRRRLARLKEEEKYHRDAFLAQHGDSLPEDIWPGIQEPLSGVNMAREAGGQVPVLSGSVLSAARARQGQRGQQRRQSSA